METDESDSESMVMESHVSPQAEQEEAAEETHVTELKPCSVMLDRLEGDKTEKTELEDKEDMNRKGGKPVSRIPTFHKRPTGVSQNTELPVPKKDPPASVVPEMAGSGSVEVSKSKLPDVRERVLPPPSVRAPTTGFDGPSAFTGTESTAYSSLITGPKIRSLLESVQNPLMTVSPRPAIRPGHDQEVSESPEVKPDVPVAHLPHEHSPGHKLQRNEAEKTEPEIKSMMAPPDSGHLNLESGEPAQVTEEIPDTVDAIMDEEPPWETEPSNVLELKVSESSSEAECEEDGHDSEQQSDLQEMQVIPTQVASLAEKKASIDEFPSSATQEMPAKAGSTRSKKRSTFCSFALLCFLPTALLILGGFGQHVWHYGLPLSVAQLTAQLELHWLEGLRLMPEPCSTDCRVHLVESIPAGLYESSPPPHQSIAQSWLRLLHKANSSVHIAAFYFTLRSSDMDSSDYEGKMVFKHLKKLESKGVRLQIAVNAPQTSTQDTADLAASGAEVREVNLKAVTGGIVHTKLWVVDQTHLYVGSANMDWRSLTQVKEVGLLVEDCSCLAQDASRIFDVYWSIGGTTNGSLPPYWPARLSALSNSQNPLQLKFNGVPAQVYLSSAPPQVSTRGRSDDLTTILSVIDDAQEFVYISVMDFIPLSEFTTPLRFWPALDSALRSAACTRGVQVRLMVSCWEHSSASMFIFLQSLVVLNRPPLSCDIEVKVFTVPSTAEQKKIPYARVNHAKYMVTDRVLYIGTSNWSETYFTQTAGVGLVVNQTGSDVRAGQQTLQSQAEELFLRDWTSQYSGPLTVDQQHVCSHRSL
ncbi:phospholipase D3 isoform X2 [Sphaeramia orbicularis]|uniref:phospholipase D3 isoform X2 n=1 Tax=Sphaeramia orbicularis TaxID=375764 RepID=UPI00118114B4|nr:phospholipase D3-like isoform X2 [Sphaeramia orbicularis]